MATIDIKELLEYGEVVANNLIASYGLSGVVQSRGVVGISVGEALESCKSMVGKDFYTKYLHKVIENNIKSYISEEFKYYSAMVDNNIYVGTFFDEVGVSNRLLVYKLLRVLSDYEKFVIKSLFFSGLTQDELSKILGVSQQYVEKIKSGSIIKMKEYANEIGASFS